MHPSLARLAKWNLHRFYSKHSKIAKYLPPTTFFSSETLSSFLQKYKNIYIKANRVHTGRGIIKAWKTANGFQFVKIRVNKERIESTKKQLISLSHEIMRYSEKFPFYSFQCGIDLAVDKNGRIWIIEVNLHNPSHGLFNKLENKTFFRRIGHLYTDYRKHNKRLI
ncbi:YheC/YheD family protein [Paenibacillus sp. TAF58]